MSFGFQPFKGHSLGALPLLRMIAKWLLVSLRAGFELFAEGAGAPVGTAVRVHEFFWKGGARHSEKKVRNHRHCAALVCYAHMDSK